ncbi:DUF1003 domain-containing protein [Rahnella aquatilis]|uniref:DUF1003 domain-containing protein n=1 Tax=Rahnella aquatilis TaxID=34038 RepID=UPI0006491E4F
MRTGIIFDLTSYKFFIKKSAFDPCLFILLNLFLSFQSTYTAPTIMMNQKRQKKNDHIRREIDGQQPLGPTLSLHHVKENRNG